MTHLRICNGIQCKATNYEIYGRSLTLNMKFRCLLVALPMRERQREREKEEEGVARVKMEYVWSRKLKNIHIIGLDAYSQIIQTRYIFRVARSSMNRVKRFLAAGKHHIN